jgi:hypothetical protein
VEPQEGTGSLKGEQPLSRTTDSQGEQGPEDGRLSVRRSLGNGGWAVATARGQRVAERRYGSLGREGPEGVSLDVPAGRNKPARCFGVQAAERLRKPEGGRRRRLEPVVASEPEVLRARRGKEPQGRSRTTPGRCGG